MLYFVWFLLIVWDCWLLLLLSCSCTLCAEKKDEQVSVCYNLHIGERHCTRSRSVMREIALQGIYPPIPTFFDTHDELDIATYQRHIARLAGGGIRGYVVMGSNGEAVHLNSDERATVIEVARQAA